MSSNLFPNQTPSYILAFQFSSWYPRFSKQSIKSTIVRPLSQDFIDYLNSESVFVPEGSEDLPAESTLSDESEDEEEYIDEPAPRRYAFPELDKQIRDSVKKYGAIFPKLNFSSPKDASWVLPSSSPLKCTCPADIYLLLKSSDFISHDLSVENVFNGCLPATSAPSPHPSWPEYHLELVLRKWYPVDTSRELRCFVRQNRLLAISQRDRNYYDFFNDLPTQEKIITTVETFWQSIRSKWDAQEDYIFDFLLTRDLSQGHLLDFNPYAPRTDPLLFTYQDLCDLLLLNDTRPKLRVIDSPSHPAGISNAPAHQHNMIPFEALSLGNGRNIEEFAEIWKETVRESTI
ncbi:hypothetical protein K443DRAFT_85979 [Laccaria amethystina LaAM-08-1]|uniref:Uncharacterized protein n=1 Tax=Laccaria amethystina LaAM-08-1 TaxID=1095629 RepID=A0A0C9Y2B5_9AGAR|nr:hypothetical protein K443DRAFT_85979 [Laccaria amethystina LaAM-08-1]